MRLVYHPAPPMLVIIDGTHASTREIITLTPDEATNVAYTILSCVLDDSAQALNYAPLYAQRVMGDESETRFETSSESVRFWVSSVRENGQMEGEGE